MIPYEPQLVMRPPWLLDVPTAWNGVESILMDILTRFKVKMATAVEFGVDYGYSTSALACFFQRVIGVDTFKGDPHAGWREAELFDRVCENFAKSQLRNVTLLRMDMREFMVNSAGQYDFIHIDVFHEYEPTRLAAEWAISHSPVVMLHDTRAFPEVMRACEDVAKDNEILFFEYPEHHGVGILSRREPR